MAYNEFILIGIGTAISVIGYFLKRENKRLEEMDDLIKEFGNPDDSKNSFVVNNVIRKEPSIWIAPDAEPQEREKRLLEAVDHLPRPLLLYVTKVDDAAKWVDCLKNSPKQNSNVLLNI